MKVEITSIINDRGLLDVNTRIEEYPVDTFEEAVELICEEANVPYDEIIMDDTEAQVDYDDLSVVIKKV